MKLGERKYTQDEGPAQEPWTEAPGKSPRAADGKTGVQDAPRRRGVRGTDAGESACETPEAPEKHKFRLFTGDRVLWIIVAALAVISVLVVYSSTAKMAYDAHTARTTAHFLRQQLIILVVSLIIMVAVQKINCRIYNLFSRPVYFLSVALTVAVYFIGATTNGAARWIPLGPFQFQPSEALKVATVLFLARQLAGRQSKIDKIRIVPSLKFWTWRSSREQRRIWREGTWPILMPVVVSCAVIFPAHTSSAVLVFMASWVMMLIGRVRLGELVKLIGLACIGIIFIMTLNLGRSETAEGRVSTWIHLWTRSEALKVATVLFLARQLAGRQSKIDKIRIVPSLKFWTWRSSREQRRIWREGTWPILMPVVVSCAVIFPAHTSSAVLVFMASWVMMLIGRVRLGELVKLIGLACIGIIFIMTLNLGRSETAEGRVSTWIHLWTRSQTEKPIEHLTDTERSMIAIHNGGVFGEGAGQSAMRVEMIHPESDYAYAFFVEEYGIVLALALLMLYLWIFFRGIEIFRRCGTAFPGLLVLGLALLITCQALLHIMVTVNLIPETGQTLPLISRGGSSTIFTTIALGMILSVSRQNDEQSHDTPRSESIYEK